MENVKKCCCCEAAADNQEVSEGDAREIAEAQQETEECPCCRTRLRSDEELKDLIHRLNRVEGQIRGIRAMVEEDRYCVDILTQVSAAKSALNGFSQVLLDQHIRTCVAERLQQGDQEVVDELTMVIRKLTR